MSEQVDLLYEDPAIGGQKYTCISFVSPEKIIEKKELYMFEKFLNNWDLNKRLELFENFLNFISYKYKLDNGELEKDFKSFVKEEFTTLKDNKLLDDYKNFIEKHEESLEKDFNEINKFQTSVRGIKVRGTFSSQEEAEKRCKVLRELDPGHDVFVGPVGLWMPWDPDAYKTGKVEHLEEELNNLMSQKQKNEEKAKESFDLRVKTAKEQAIENNKKIAVESGNKLTQNIDESVNLVSVNSLENNISVSDIEKELFDKSEVRLKNDTEIKMKT